jgi:hypothetical protein
MNPMEIIGYLRGIDYATIRCYLENEKYVYLMVVENKSSDTPVVYHWIINKDNAHETVVKMDRVIDSCWFSPQLLTEDHMVYYLGYPVGDDDRINFDSNPSIVMMDISGL